MKKIFLVLIALMGCCLSMNAQDASAICRLPGPHDYVSVDFYAGESLKKGGGDITYSVQSNDILILNEIKVVIKAEIMTKKATKVRDGYKYDERGNYVEAYKVEPAVWEEYTFYNDKIRDIVVNRTNHKFVDMPRYYKIKNITVEVSNPICK